MPADRKTAHGPGLVDIIRCSVESGIGSCEMMRGLSTEGDSYHVPVAHFIASILLTYPGEIGAELHQCPVVRAGSRYVVPRSAVDHVLGLTRSVERRAAMSDTTERSGGWMEDIHPAPEDRGSCQDPSEPDPVPSPAKDIVVTMALRPFGKRLHDRIGDTYLPDRAVKMARPCPSG